MPKKLSHYDAQGRSRMVDVTSKRKSAREAEASALVVLEPAVLRALPRNPKGDPLEVARLAGIMAAKRTADLIPMCHPLPLSHIAVTLRVCENGVSVASKVRTNAETGVEMEALVAAGVAALTVYDMCKALDKGIEIRELLLERKSGGKSSDYRMPGMDGRQLLEKLKSRPATANIAVILMASKGDISERLSLQDPVEDYLEKPFFLKDATHKIKRVVDRIALEKLSKAASTDGILRGSLSQMNVIDLVQSLEMGRKSCLLTMTNGDDKCEIYFSQGQAKHAAYGPITGDEAVFKVLRWTEGNFQIDFKGKSA